MNFYQNGLSINKHDLSFSFNNELLLEEPDILKGVVWQMKNRKEMFKLQHHIKKDVENSGKNVLF